MNELTPLATMGRRLSHVELDPISPGEALERLDGLFRTTKSLDSLMSEALDLCLGVFGCDRAFLFYPCDPQAPTWRVPMERTREGWPGALAQGVEHPMDEASSSVLALTLAESGPVPYGPGYEHPVPEPIGAAFSIRSQLLLALRPLVGQAWLLGLHACAGPKEWAPEEVELFGEMGSRMGQVLATLLALEEQRDREARLRDLLDMSQESVLILSARGRVLDANANAPRLLKLPRAGLLNQDFLSLAPEQQPDGRGSREAGEELVARAAREGLLVFEWTLRSTEGEDRLCEVRLAPVRETSPLLLRASVADISRRREIEIRLRHRERVEGVGRLVGGIVHDFNNILTVISTATELARREVARHAPGVAEEHLSLVRDASRRAAGLTHQLLAYARKQVVEPRGVNLNEVVESSQGMLQHALNEGVELRLHLAADLWKVLVDPGQFVQILMNLVTNARDALPGGGRIDLETFNVVLDEDYCRHDPELQPGRYGVLAVSDDGTGMSPEVVSELFEPFFTTKPRGQGTGLGLATVYGIVRQHQGLVTVYSEEGEGSCFKVYLPQTEAEVVEDAPLEAPLRSDSAHTILLVEDDAMVRRVTAAALRVGGYEVLETASGGEALESLRSAAEARLVLSDVVLQDTNGVALLERLRALQPGIPALFMSGYTENVVAKKGVLKPGIDFLHKPFTTEDLLRRVREAIHRPPAH